MKPLVLIYCLLFFVGCIPIKIAPSIKDDKVIVAKKFKRKLPNKMAFIFEDKKEVKDFHTFINKKYNLNYQGVDWTIPIEIEDESFFFTFKEVEISDKSLNLLPILFNESTFFEDEEQISRYGNWYLVITVADIDMNDCLKENNSNREKLLKFLRDLKAEYITN